MGVWVACECRPVEQPANLMDDLLGLSTASASAPAASDPFASDLSGVMNILDTMSKPSASASASADPMDFTGLMGSSAGSAGSAGSSENVIDYGAPAPVATEAPVEEAPAGEREEAM